MRIAVNFRSRSEPITEISRYTLCMLQLMVKNSSHEWVSYSYRLLKNGSWNQRNVRVRTLKFPK